MPQLMKHIPYIFCALLLSLALVACSNNGSVTGSSGSSGSVEANSNNTPQAVAQKYVTSAYQGDSAAVLKQMHLPPNENNGMGMNDIFIGKIKMMVQEFRKEDNKKGGVTSITISKPTYSSDKTQAKLDVLVQFNNGENKKAPVVTVLVDNTWKIYFAGQLETPTQDIAAIAHVNTITEPIRTFSKHAAEITDIAFSPDGQTLASVGYDETIRLWNTTIGKPLNNLKKPPQKTFSVAFAPNGKTMAVGDDKSITLWEFNTGKLLHQLRKHSNNVKAIAFSPDGQRIISGSADKTARVWNTKTGKSMYTLKGHDIAVTSVAFSPDGDTVATAGMDSTVRLWNAETEKPTQTFTGNLAGGGLGGSVTSIAFSPNGKLIAAGSYDSFLHIWNIQTGELIFRKKYSALGVHAVAFSPNGQLIAIGSTDGNVYILDIHTKKTIHILEKHAGVVGAVAFSPNGKWLASGGRYGIIHLWKVDFITSKK